MLDSFLSDLGLLIYVLLIIAVALQVMLKRRPVGVTLTWLLLIFAVPLLGIICYQLFGERYLGRLRARRARVMETKYKQSVHQFKRSPHAVERSCSEQAEPLNKLTRRLLGLPILGGNLLQNLEDSLSTLSQITQDIHQAKTTIYLEFYIVQLGGLVEPLLDALAHAAQRKVSVYLLADSVGSREFLSSEKKNQLEHAGVNVIEALHANPIRMLLQRIDLRLHRKIAAIDQHVAYTGSMNLVDPRLFNQQRGLGQWVDLMLRVEGPAAVNLQAVVAYDIEMETGLALIEQLDLVSPAASAGQQLMQIMPSGPGIFGDHIIQLLLSSLYLAKQQIVLTSPYFVPDESLQMALVTAANRGVEVNLILPARNDSFLVRYASHSFYQQLLDAGVNIFKFNGGLLHTKSLLIDQQVALVGTVNLDMRSLWLNFEVTSIIDDKDYAKDLYRIMQHYLQQSSKVDAIAWRKRPVYRRLMENIIHIFSPLL
ncbi:MULTISPECIES: cardiolipin synthase [unclassified Agarivorans]|uniref:cardiolipin synthase n=1 Tax=unclassified Agarivorans TaxID=2636026 RepID=UPI0026E2A1B0|nr:MULTISPECIES: cardiolipin synthase [unclassified Agarivorans]MDO6685454.1 cardiolipin synthase [Agarivorans sp. 3_MG-2023]MDO6715840.1 cardiolipin synthase [Agarivorans sp. 2_MG-2023]